MELKKVKNIILHIDNKINIALTKNIDNKCYIKYINI